MLKPFGDFSANQHGSRGHSLEATCFRCRQCWDRYQTSCAVLCNPYFLHKFLPRANSPIYEHGSQQPVRGDGTATGRKEEES